MKRVFNTTALLLSSEHNKALVPLSSPHKVPKFEPNSILSGSRKEIMRCSLKTCIPLMTAEGKWDINFSVAQLLETCPCSWREPPPPHCAPVNKPETRKESKQERVVIEERMRTSRDWREEGEGKGDIRSSNVSLSLSIFLSLCLSIYISISIYIHIMQ